MNEAPYLREWIEYHKIIGVEKFYIFDNYGADNIKYVLSYSVHRGDYMPFMKIVTLTSDTIHLNHYWTKSWEEWCSKCPKKDVEYSEMNGDKYRLITKYDPCFLSNTEDRVIEKYLPELKKRM